MYIKSVIGDELSVDFCYEDAGMKETMLVIETNDFSIDLYCKLEDAEKLVDKLTQKISKFKQRRR